MRWSHVSLCDAEYNLYKSVIKSGQNYSYVHLISGVDFPLYSQDKLHEFFERRHDEFIDLRYPDKFRKRLKYYHLFVKYRRQRPIFDWLRRAFLLPQIPVVDRLRNIPLKYAYGSEWCSLTQRAVLEIVQKYPKYRYMFRYTTCSDEHYKQMILLSAGNFKFAKEGCLRYVDFSDHNPSPRVLTVQDLNKIMSSHCIFARKFEERVDSEVINIISNKVNGKKKNNCWDRCS